MSPPDDLYPPVTHDAVWPVVAVLALAVVALWWLGWWWRSRPRHDVASRWAPLQGRALHARRARGLAELDAVVVAHEAGELSTREAFQQISPLVRRFVFDVVGIPAHTMTLDVLERDQPGLVADVVALCYPLEFAAVVHGDVRVGAEQARHVVLTWAPETRSDAAPVGSSRWP